jgi:hypothetical protein
LRHLPLAITSERDLRSCTQEAIVAPDPEPGNRKRVETVAIRAQCERGDVTGGLRRSSNTIVLLAIWVGEQLARPSQLGFDPLARLDKLASKLLVIQLGEVWVARSVRTHLYSSIRKCTELVPTHRGELGGLRSDFMDKLRYVERRSILRMIRARENRGGYPEALEGGQRTRNAPKRVVERDMKAAPSRERQLLGPHRSI